jgi:hypothetical protein
VAQCPALLLYPTFVTPTLQAFYDAAYVEIAAAAMFSLIMRDVG